MAMLLCEDYIGENLNNTDSYLHHRRCNVTQDFLCVALTSSIMKWRYQQKRLSFGADETVSEKWNNPIFHFREIFVMSKNY